jgi:hypothetical protein
MSAWVRSAAFAGLVAACGADDEVAGAPVDAARAPPDATRSAPDAAASPPDASAAACTVLFGVPNARTGLTDAQCGPSCACEGLDFTPPAYDAAFIEALRGSTLVPPFEDLPTDPYAAGAAALAPAAPEAVCGVRADASAPGAYSVATYADPPALTENGATLTHFGACGVCSTLTDLAVYMAYPDLTEPVRACGLLGLSDGDAANYDCLLELGFTPPCARVWFYNTRHTRQVCLAQCLMALDSPYHLPDGTLNPCLTCDEEKSGPVFKAVAGRTRRNSGLPNAMCRPCAEANPVVHAYPLSGSRSP